MVFSFVEFQQGRKKSFSCICTQGEGLDEGGQGPRLKWHTHIQSGSFSGTTYLLIIQSSFQHLPSPIYYPFGRPSLCGQHFNQCISFSSKRIEKRLSFSWAQRWSGMPIGWFKRYIYGNCKVFRLVWAPLQHHVFMDNGESASRSWTIRSLWCDSFVCGSTWILSIWAVVVCLHVTFA